MIQVERLSRRFGTTSVLEALTFDVRPGVVTGFVGPNGAGKSTTMRIMVGLTTPSGGGVLINGRRYHEFRDPLRVVGSLLDDYGFHPSRAARNHLGFLAAANRLPRRRIDEVLCLTGLDSVASRRVGRFSLGMKQRLGLAAALLGDPEILILDEPNNGLDPEGITWLRELLGTLASEGRTVLVSSHLISELALSVDHLLVIGRGRLLADEPIGALTSGGEVALEAAYLGLTRGLSDFSARPTGDRR